MNKTASIASYFLHQEKLKEIHDRLNSIDDNLERISDNPNHRILNNSEFCKVLNICKKTAQRIRNQGMVKYSKVGSSIFYIFSDVLEMLDKNSYESLN